MVGVFYCKITGLVDKLKTEILSKVHPQWLPLVKNSLDAMDSHYLNELADSDWLPGKKALLNAFSQPLTATTTILFGESPYPRAESANGYAFWDGRVGSIWSDTGLSKEVNRATSLRNMIKMLLLARGDLSNDFSQHAIALVDKTRLVKNLSQLFNNFINNGIMLLNASLVLSSHKVAYDAKHWQVFMDSLLQQLTEVKPSLNLLLFGKVATRIHNIENFTCVIAEHPYNISFITNQVVIDFFKPLDLLRNYER